MSHHLTFELKRFDHIRRRLLELHPEIDEQTLADTLEGATDLNEALASLIRSALEDECLARALKERIETMRGRLGRLETRATSKRQVAVEAMEQTSVRKLVQPDFTASVRMAPPSVEISDDRILPAEFLLPQPAKPDKRSILAAIVGGGTVPGACLAPAKISLSVRSQ